MVKKLRIISFVLIFLGISIRFILCISISHDISSQNKIIDDVFSIDVSDNFSDDSSYDVRPNENVNYLGYIDIPRFNVRRIIKYGTDDNILNDMYVGIHSLSGPLSSTDMIILAGHNVFNVFSKLHYISAGDEVFINGYNFSRKFVVYDKKIVNEYDVDYLLDNRKNELLLITCTKKSGERLLVFLKEVL